MMIVDGKKMNSTVPAFAFKTEEKGFQSKGSNELWIT